MAKGATTHEAIKALIDEGYAGPRCNVVLTKFGLVAKRIPEVIHMPKSARREEQNRIYMNICKGMMEYKRRKWKKGLDVEYGEFYKFVQANVVTASCGFGYPRYELNSYEAPYEPKILGCKLDAENKMRVRVAVRNFPRYFTAGAIRIFFKLYYCGVKAEAIGQVIRFDKADAANFEEESVIEGMAVGAYQFGVDYIRFSQTNGGVLHIYADVGGTPDEKTTICTSSRAHFRFELPQRVLDARAEKIRQHTRDYTRDKNRKIIENKGIKKFLAEKNESAKRYYKRNRQRINERRREHYNTDPEYRERELQRKRAWRQRNPDKVNAARENKKKSKNPSKALGRLV